MDNTAHFNIDTVFTDTLNWVQLKGSMVADLPYSYLALGSFYEKENLIIESYHSQFDLFAYYGIDDVRLSTDSAYVFHTSVSEPTNVVASCWYNSTTEEILIQCEQTVQCTVFNSSGKRMLETVVVGSTALPARSFTNGLY
ncbi:MAG: hypothetical protein SH856_11050, partial [Flavobacteriales bacterium]|nr:hypothetical protein [Flavobacteriales bacterium]